jgi:hypothetical protein
MEVTVVEKEKRQIGLFLEERFIYRTRSQRRGLG